MEKLDVYDGNRIKLNKTLYRGESLGENEYHLVVHLVIMNDKNEMLIQRRALTKAGFPGMWDISVGGCVVANETSQMAMERELKEELGLALSFQNMRPQLTLNTENAFDDIYVIRCGVDLKDLTLQKEEVMEVKWANRDEIFQMMIQHEFIPYPLGLIQLYFDLNQ